MSNFFDFEADFVDSLRCIPMVVRFKLDTCGVKLKLAAWNLFNQSERSQLVELPCTEPAEVTLYRDYVMGLVVQHTGQMPSTLGIDDNPAWLRDREIPTAVQDKAQTFHTHLTTSQWANLTPLQRFALIKLTRSQHENTNFLPALKEFGLDRTSSTGDR
jgi:hypothetical protein